MPSSIFRHIPRRRLVPVIVLAAVFSLLPLPGIEFSPVASASSSAAGDLQRFGTRESDGRVEVVIGEHGTRVFTLLALTYSGSPSGTATVRVRDAADGWSDWAELEVATGEGPDSSTSEGSRAAADGPDASTVPFLVDSGTDYEIRLPMADVDVTDVVVVRESLERTVTVAVPAADAADPGLTGLRSRADWSARAPKQTASVAPAVDFAVVHHSVSGNGYSEAGVAAQIRSIQAYHMDGNGWDDIGYNFVVDRFGGIWEGRNGGAANAVVGAHAGGFNRGSVGVMILGNYTSVAPSGAALESVARVIGWKLALNRTSATGTLTYTSAGSAKYPAGTVVTIPKVVGHGDVGSTTCPGVTRNSLGSIRTRAQQWVDHYTARMAPIGRLDVASANGSSVTAAGWAIAPHDRASARIAVSVDGRTITGVASRPRPDVAAVYPGFSPAGFHEVIAGVRPGVHAVCVDVVDPVDPSRLTRIACKNVTVGSGDAANTGTELAALESVVGGVGRLDITGWSYDMDSSDSTNVAIIVDGWTRTTVRADRSTPRVPASHGAPSSRSHGFSASVIGLTAGAHDVCISASTNGSVGAQILDCRRVTISGATPSAVLDFVTPGVRSFHIQGWAVDRETTAPLRIRVSVDGRSSEIVADRPRRDVGALFPGYGDAHGFDAVISVDGGKRTICVTAVNVGGGTDKSLGCHNVNVVK